MDLPIPWPLPPMLAKLAREVPGDGFLYEPKWDGFRSIAARERDEVDLRSRHGRPFARYFPELVEALRAVECDKFVLDGEIVLRANGTSDFNALLARIHPAATRVERLSAETPAAYVAFDLLAIDGDELLTRPFRERRRRLERLFAAVEPPLHLTPVASTPDEAARWLELPPGGVDGVVAKELARPYEPGVRAMVKVKHERTADCVVAGFRWLVDRPLPSSLLLGLYDEHGELRHVGVASSFTQRAREQLLATLRPRVVGLRGHPWEHGFLLEGNPTGRLRGAAGRWTPDMTQDWTPVAPELVCEVRYDQLDADRFRHPARFVRWRPDREPTSCTFDQLALARDDATVGVPR
ncbi:MAG TPA: ATP-dependent DNA ligase [Gaiellaceae bacterium]|nr:ATP-dependent DNA ligase [Gaiellaceae bacterium]